MGPDKSTLDSLRIDRGTEPVRGRAAWWLILLILILLAGGMAGWWWRQSKPPEVQVVVVQESGGAGQTTLLNASGYVVARREATVSSKVTGKVMEVLVEEGMHVDQDQILARLDSSNIKTSLDLAEAQLVSAKSGVEEIKVRLLEAELEFKRVSGLATNRVSSEKELDHATAELNSLRARLVQQLADVEVAQRQVAVWQQQLDDSLIRAPFSGIVVSKNAQPGEMISPISAGGGFTRTGICTIVDMDSLEIEVDVNESYLNRVVPDRPVEATLDAYPDWKIPCKVKAIIPTADRQKATVKVRVTFDRLDPRLLPQMGVKVAFQAGAETPAKTVRISIPKRAVRQQDGRDIVFLLQDGRVERRAVRVSSGSGDDLLVSAGLAAGDKVIVSGPDGLKPGDPIQEARP